MDDVAFCRDQNTPWGRRQEPGHGLCLPGAHSPLWGGGQGSGGQTIMTPGGELWQETLAGQARGTQKSEMDHKRWSGRRTGKEVEQGILGKRNSVGQDLEVRKCSHTPAPSSRM